MNKPAYSKPAGGFSLVELMVGLAIGLVLAVAAGTLWISSKTVYEVQNDMGRIQENGRFAIRRLQYELRMAGYFGCSDDSSTRFNTLVNSGTNDDVGGFLHEIEGFEAGNTSAWQPSGSTENIADIRSGTDAITIRRMSESGYRVTLAVSATATAITLDSTQINLPDNQPVVVSDCVSSTVVKVDGDLSDNGDGTSSLPITPAMGRIYEEQERIPNGTDADGNTIYETITKTHVSRYEASRYYVSTEATLRRRFVNASGEEEDEELVKGIENMQLLYGVDSTNDGIPDSYVTAGAVSDWRNVSAVKVGLLVRSNEEFGLGGDSSIYQVLNQTVAAVNDRRRRRVYTAEIQLRNF